VNVRATEGNGVDRAVHAVSQRLPLRTIILQDASDKRAPDVNVVVFDQDGLDRVVSSCADLGPSPGVGVPGGQIVHTLEARAGKLAAHPDFLAVHRDGIHRAVHAWAEREPVLPIPSGNVATGDASGAAERTAEVNIAAADRNGINLAFHARKAESIVPCAVAPGM